MEERRVFATTEYDCDEGMGEGDDGPLLTASPPDEESEWVTHPNNRTSPGTDADTMSIAAGEG